MGMNAPGGNLPAVAPAAVGSTAVATGHPAVGNAPSDSTNKNASNGDNLNKSFPWFLGRLGVLAAFGGIGGLVDMAFKLGGAPWDLVMKQDKIGAFGTFELLCWNLPIYLVLGACTGLFLTMLLANKDLADPNHKYFYTLVLAIAGGLFWQPILEKIGDEVGRAGDGKSLWGDMQEAAIENSTLKSSTDKLAKAQDRTASERTDEEERKLAEELSSKGEKTADKVLDIIVGMEAIAPSSTLEPQAVQSVSSAVSSLNTALETTGQVSSAASKNIAESIEKIRRAAESSSNSELKESVDKVVNARKRIVYVQAEATDHEIAQQLVDQLNRRGLLSPEVDEVGGNKPGEAPTTTEIRYFHDEDQRAAEAVAAVCEYDFNWNIKPVLQPNELVPLGQIEVWLAKDAQRGERASAAPPAGE